MTKLFSRPLLATSVPVVTCAVAVALQAAPAAKNVKAPQKSAKVTTQSAAKIAPKATGDFLTLAQIKALQRQRERQGNQPGAALQPFWDGQALKLPMRDLLSGPTPDFGAKVKTANGLKKVDPKRYAQVFPRPVAPVSTGSLAPATLVLPKWVRYPLEFQLAGIGLGTRAVDKDRFNRIDRYGLFALHGNPTAVVRQVDISLFGGSTGGAGGGDGGGAGAGGGTTSTVGSLALPQTPPELSTLFPSFSPDGGLPSWALNVTLQLDNNHVEWLYQRDTYSMGFVVDRLGFVDAIVVSGTESPIARTQLEDQVHTVKLGDDLRKVLFRYGYPDDVVPLASDPAASAVPGTGANTGTAGGAGGAGGGDAGGGAAAGGAGGGVTVNSTFTTPVAITSQNTAIVNAAYRTFDLRYEQSYNVVFTIRNNRVVRMYIFGDPDFFNQQRRNNLRTKY